MTPILGPLEIVVQDESGGSVEGARVTLARRDHASFTAYLDPDGAQPTTGNQAYTGPDGTVTFWLARGSYSYTVSYGNEPFGPYFDDVTPADDVSLPASDLVPFTLDVLTPSSDITVPHNLGRQVVSVTALDPSGTEVIVGWQALNNDTVVVSTDPGLPFSGKVVVI